MITITDELRAELAEPGTWRIPRTGGRALKFEGWRVAEGSHGTGGTSGYACDWNRGVNVYLYLTSGGRLVCVREYWSQWQGEDGRWDVRLCEDTDQLYRALVDSDDLADEEEGRLRPAEKEAWQELCRQYPEILPEDCEVIE